MSKDLPPIILSASRRTDIPAFYLDWFLNQMNEGYFVIKNPYTKKSKRFQVSPDTIHTIVFWSKNFDHFIKKKAGEKLKKDGFNLYFNFSINPENPILEPNVPDLSSRIKQLKQLSDCFGPESITWRFDPICFYQTKANTLPISNLDHFQKISQMVSGTGISRCVTSFFDPYPKIGRRLKKSGLCLKFIDPPMAQKTSLIEQMARDLSDLGIHLYLCCEKEIFNTLNEQLGVRQNACIDGRMFQNRSQMQCVTSKDYGQRFKKGCQCTKSVDVGSYDDHPCYHNCLFCYARPLMDTLI